jgi:hypothetical protein
VTCRRLVLFAADPLVTAISLAFRVEADSHAAGSTAFGTGSPGAAAHSTPTARAPGFTCVLDRRGGTVRAGHPSVSPDAPGASIRRWTSLAHRITRSTSSGSEQITLSVDAVEDPPTVPHGAEMRILLRRLERTSLNPKSRLVKGVA